MNKFMTRVVAGVALATILGLGVGAVVAFALAAPVVGTALAAPVVAVIGYDYITVRMR
jgi:hypothetical protein